MRDNSIYFYKDLRVALLDFQEQSPEMLEKYAKLLAWVYAYGGGCEAVTLNLRMVADIAVAQKIFNVSGGERPQHTEILQKYLQEVKFALSRKEYPKDTEHPAWAYEICEKYNIKPHYVK